MSGSIERRRTRPRTIAGAVGAAMALALVGCDTGDGKTLKDPVGTVAPPTTTAPVDVQDVVPGDPALTATLPASLPADDVGFRVFAPWSDGAAIDPRHTCDGIDVSPAVSWVAPPAGTVELAVAVVDDSITNGPPFVHWVIAGIDPAAGSLLEGTPPVGAVQALNFFGDVGWGGPCPPPGEGAHDYRLTLFALNQQVELADGTPATDLLDFVELVAIASIDVVGTYGR
ncbi:MAG: YbhB/YbcL family Raf kinase inhibitor-like protein [Ilumatobacter sp.]|nr:YbhB/YbcL family Raf kinase inhibitor-like protein [Ilumatobacter sp.]